MASRPFHFLEKKRSKIRKRSAKYFEGLAALSCYFFGSVATTSGHFVHKSERRRRDGVFIYALSADESSPALAAPRHASTALFSCRF